MPALTAVITHATGDVYPASDFNTYTRDNINFLVQAGATLASAASIVTTNEFHLVSGTTTIDNLTPATPVAGQQLRLLFQGALTLRNNGAGTGNIRTLTGADRTVQANEIVQFVYDGTVWREQTLTAGSVKLFDSSPSGVSSVTTPTLPGGFRNLRIVWSARSGAAVATDNFGTRINGDSTANYNEEYLSAQATGTPSCNQLLAQTYAYTGDAPGATDTAGRCASGEIEIPDYAGTTFQKTMVARWGWITGTATTLRVSAIEHGVITAAITTLTFLMATGPFVAGSRIQVYGEM